MTMIQLVKALSSNDAENMKKQMENLEEEFKKKPSFWEFKWADRYV